MSTVTISEFVDNDTASLRNIDTSFSTGHIYLATTVDSTLQLTRIPLANPIVKTYEFESSALVDTTSFVAIEDGRACGLIGVALESWHLRLVIRHFYVDRNMRGRGVGRELMARALETGRTLGAQTAWVETSNVNAPGIAAYIRLGFGICGFDTTFYTGTPAKDEFAVFLARPI